MSGGSSPARLKIDNIECEINGKGILKDISLEAREGEFIGLIGPNGAGKSTLLKCINGIIRLKSGSISLYGGNITDLDHKSIARKVALMHQNTLINFPFTAFEVVMTGRYPYLGRYQRESPKDHEIAKRYMEYTDTWKLKDRPINQVSGGECQRVLFTKILAQETDIVLLDEPTASLDISYEEQIFEYLRQLCESGKTVIAAVHDIKTASKFCTRIVMMKDGRIIGDGMPEDVITSENLSRALGVKALVYRNRISGQLDFYVHGVMDGVEARQKAMKIHVIGGGGSASGIFRLIFKKGHNMTGGVFSAGDSDLGSAEIFGVECVVGRPFAEISDEEFNKNVEMIKASDLTILCNMPFGMQNLRNLDAAAFAEKLVIIEEGDPKGRDYTGGIALKKYAELREKSVIIDSARLHEVL